jgi:hypothetical protein
MFERIGFKNPRIGWKMFIRFFSNGSAVPVSLYPLEIEHSYGKLVGGFNHLEKFSSMGRIIPYIMENKKCSKAPPRKSMKITMFNNHL